MPSIKDFEKKKKNKQHEHDHKKSESVKTKTTEENNLETPKRRPSKEDKEEIIIEPMAQELKSNDLELESDSVNDSLNESSKIQIEFPGSILLRSKFSKAF